MTRENVLQEIADMLDMEPGDLQEDAVLDELETWDSVAILSVIAFMNEKYNKVYHASDIKKIKTVGELADMMS